MEFDTHAAVKRLAQTGLSEAQAEALVEALRGLAQSQRGDLATKTDLAGELADVRAEIGEVRVEIAGLRKEMEHLASKGELRSLENGLIRWMVGIGFALAALNTTVIALFV